MISYKKINLLDLNIQNTELRYGTSKDILILKSPIIIARKDKDGLILKINNNSDSHDKFLNMCGYINTICIVNKIKTGIILNNTIILKKTNVSKFFDENKNNISFSKLKDIQKVVCSFTCCDGCFLIEHCLMIN
jgi:hypothetical protein|tara:strand:+ start:5099 stop:5500 length:402 start_codon:yes stop_codon:yes gene_type:complete